jgi:hypothetical protein
LNNSSQEEKALEKSPAQEEVPGASKPAESTEISNRLLGVEKQIERLRASLPPGLRVLARKGPSEEQLAMRRCEREFFRELRENGFIELQGFWVEGAGLSDSIKGIKVGAELRVEVNDAADRTNVLMLTDKQGVPTGVITNTARPAREYQMFKQALCDVLGKSRFPVKLVEISPPDPKMQGSITFKVVTTPGAIHARRAQYLNDANPAEDETRQ